MVMKYEAPVLITGTSEARAAFDKSLDGILGVRDNVVIVDTALFSSVHRSGCAQHVAIMIENGKELKHVIQLLKLWSDETNVTIRREDYNEEASDAPEVSDGEKSENEKEVKNVADDTVTRSGFHNQILIAGCISALKDCCVVRLLALRMGGVGVLLFKESETNRKEAWEDSKNDQAAMVVFKNIISSWISGDNEMALNSWGDAQWAPKGDVIIPPGWDSVAKVRAVADAFGVPFDSILSEGQMPSSLDNNDEAGASMLQSSIHEPDEGPNPFTSWRKKHAEWMVLMGEKLQKGLSSKDDHVTTLAGSDFTNKRRSEGDFFQRLLTSHR